MPTKPREIIIAQRAVGKSVVRREREGSFPLSLVSRYRWIVGILGISVIKVRGVLV